MVWSIYLKWLNGELFVASGYMTAAEANAAVHKWRMQNNCDGVPFLVRHEHSGDPGDNADDDPDDEDEDNYYPHNEPTERYGSE